MNPLDELLSATSQVDEIAPAALQNGRTTLEAAITSRGEARPAGAGPARPRARQPRRAKRGQLVAVSVAVAAAVAGGTTASVVSRHPGGGNAGPAAAGAPATTAAVLDRIARAAAAAPAVKVGPDQYFYVKAQVTGTSTFAKSGRVEGWIAQSQSKETLWRDNGHSEPLQTGVASAAFGGPVIGLTMSDSPGLESSDKLLYPAYAYLESLPANPRQLLNLIQRQVSPVGRSDVEAFLMIGQLLSTAVLPPQTAAGLYRAAALIPGVTVVPDATDALGRDGIGIAYSYAGDYKDSFRLREEWIFSTSTYQFLGARTSITTLSATNHEVTQTSASAVLARGIANSPGGTPTLIK